jgi:hypothetical protein
VNTDTFTGKDPVVSYIDTDICVHSPGRTRGCDCVTEDAHRCVVTVVCTGIYYWLMCHLELQHSMTFDFYDGSKGEERLKYYWTCKPLLLIHSLMMAPWC